MDATKRDSLIRVYRDGLLDDVVPFWLKHGVDRENGGIFSCLDRDGSVFDTDKSIWIQGRFARSRKVVAMIEILIKYGVLASGKALMTLAIRERLLLL
jgi:hypothetical protein